MAILNVIATGYRATLEEQDDTILWLSTVLQNNGADVGVLLRGNAVNYLVQQECPPLKIGSTGINHPPKINEDLRRLNAKGAQTFAIREDLEERGIDQQRCISEVQLIRRADVPTLMDDYEQVWHW